MPTPEAFVELWRQWVLEALSCLEDGWRYLKALPMHWCRSTFGVRLASVVWRDDTCQVDCAPWSAQFTVQDWAVASL